jgi:hypothetical protein
MIGVEEVSIRLVDVKRIKQREEIVMYFFNICESFGMEWFRSIELSIWGFTANTGRSFKLCVS